MEKEFERGDIVRKMDEPFKVGLVSLDYGNGLLEVLWMNAMKTEGKLQTVAYESVTKTGERDTETLERLYSFTLTQVVGDNESNGTPMVLLRGGKKFYLREVGDEIRVHSNGREVWRSTPGVSVQDVLRDVQSGKIVLEESNTMVATAQQAPFPSFIKSLKILRGTKARNLLAELDTGKITEATFFPQARERLGPKGWSRLAALAKSNGVDVPQLDEQYLVDLGRSMKGQKADASEVLWELSKPYYGLDSKQAAEIVKRVFRGGPVARLFSYIARDKDIRAGDKVHLASDVDGIPWGALVAVKKVEKATAWVDYAGKLRQVATKELMLPQVFVKGQSVRAFLGESWQDAVIEACHEDAFTVLLEATQHKVPYDYVRYADSRLEERALEYAMNLIEKFDIPEIMVEVAKRWKHQLNPAILKKIQERLEKQSSTRLAFFSPVLVKSGNKTLRGRFVQACSADKVMVQFADGKGIVAMENIMPYKPVTASTADQQVFILACADKEKAGRLTESLLKNGFDAQFIAQNELAVSASQDREADLYELAYDEISLDRITKQAMETGLIEAAMPFDLDEVDGDSIVYKSFKVGDRATKDVTNRYTGEILVANEERFAEKDLSTLQLQSSNRLFRAEDGSLVAFSVEKYDHTTDPYLTREVFIALRKASLVLDDIILLKDGSLFLEKDTAVTDGIKAAMKTAGPMAFVNSFHEKYMAGSLHPEIQLSYEITSVRKAIEGNNAAEFALKLTFNVGNEKHSFDLVSEGTSFVKNGVFDEIAFQVHLLNNMVRSGLDEGASYRFIRTSQYQMLRNDLAQKIGQALEKEVQMASLDSAEKSYWVSTAFVKSIHDMKVLGVNVDSRREVVSWLGENKMHPSFSEEVMAFLKRTSDFEYDRLRGTYF